MPDRIRLKWKGLKHGEPGYPGEHFAIVPIRDFTDDEYEHQLDDEQKMLIASRPDLYEDRGPRDDEPKAPEHSSRRTAHATQASADDDKKDEK